MTKKKLVVHFDARNTIFVADKCSRISTEEALNTYISGLVWGENVENGDAEIVLPKMMEGNDVCTQPKRVRPLIDAKPNRDARSLLKEIKYVNGNSQQPYYGETYDDFTLNSAKSNCLLPKSWQCLPESPCLNPPLPNAVSVYKLLEKELVKVPSDRGKLRKRLGFFTSTPEGSKFRELFETHLDKLIWPNQSDVDHELTVLGRNSTCYHYILPALFRLIRWLQDDWEGEYAIIIRTYGRDIPYILNAIKAFLDGQHPSEKPPKNCETNIDMEQTFLRRFDPEGSDEQFLYEDNVGTSIAADAKSIYESWSSRSGIFGVVDDFPYWKDHGYHYTASKPLFYSMHDPYVQHILFDDNIRYEEDGTNVVELHELKQDSPHSNGKHHTEAAKLENIFYVQADLLQIITNLNYFIEQINVCRDNYTKLLMI